MSIKLLLSLDEIQSMQEAMYMNFDMYIVFDLFSSLESHGTLCRSMQSNLDLPLTLKSRRVILLF